MGRKPKRGAVREKPGGTVESSKGRPVGVPSYGRGEAVLFSLTLFLSAFLLFTVQPMFAKMALPLLGGAPAVWNACLVFYQAALLAGYLYAHLTLKWLGPRRQAVLHLLLLCLAWIALPIRAAEGLLPPATTFPAPWLWMLLAVSLGLPFFTVSASAPMLQAWFARIGIRGPSPFAARDPYFLYAASNLGSLSALLAYPLVIEATATLARQGFYWAIGYGLLMALIAACAALLFRVPNVSGTLRVPLANGTRSVPDTLRRRLRWLALSLVPSSLLLGVTTYISSEITPMPFLWVLPLALYLSTFVLVFAPRTIVPLAWMVRLQPILIVVATITLLYSGTAAREALLFGTLHLATFFVTAMVCHGQLAADRPAAAHLTEFYLWMSLGGVLGGLFSALVAPVIFKSALEYPLMMAAACLLRPHKVAGTLRVPSADHEYTVPGPRLPLTGPVADTGAGTMYPWSACGSRTTSRVSRVWLLLCRVREGLTVTIMLLCLILAWGLRAGSFLSGSRYIDGPATRLAVVLAAGAAAFLLRHRPAVFGTAVAVLAAISLWSVETGMQLLDAERSFFGILRVEYDPLWNVHRLLNGTTYHGQQSLFAGQRREPQGYYHRTGPLGQVFEVLHARRPVSEVGVLGLGAGTIAAYAQPGERFTFYEIDPAVERIARNPDYFTYLADCRGTEKVILGDARLSLASEAERKFDLLVVDVFSSDFVPVHLMTKEALAIYLDRLNPGGLLAIHISSRYFDLAPVVGKLAEDAHAEARIRTDRASEESLGKLNSVWVVMAAKPSDLGPLADDEGWLSLIPDAGPVWTDAFSNVVGALRWKSPELLRVIPYQWTKSNEAEGHAVLAMALLQESRFDEAIEHFEKSLEIEPRSAPHHYALGVVLARKERTDEAIQHYEEALRWDPNLARAHGALGIALDRKGMHDEALKHFRRTIEISPDYVDGLRNLGKALVDRGQYEEGVAAFRKAVAIQPDSAEIRYDLGWALGRQGTRATIDEALSELRRAFSSADTEKDAALIERIKGEIHRCERWPWE
jgi:tetratricopeptide (TPR) repeat protein